jgi:hypothetical protein
VRVQLDDNLANVPSRRAQLDVLFLLAEGVHDHRLALLNAARANTDRRTWIHYVDALATTFADPEEIGYIAKASDVMDVLHRFKRSGVVRTSAAPVVKVVRGIRRAVQGRVRAGVNPLEYLARANDRAHASIAAFLHTHQIPNDLPPAPAVIRLAYPSPPGDFSAVSSTLVNEIVWTIGPTPSTFWSAIQPEMILKHEYLSHFAPRHGGLSSSVREEWLIDALIDEVDRAGAPERRFDIGVFNYLRDHLDSSVSHYSRPGSRELPERMRRSNVGLYLDMTRAIIGLKPGQSDRVEDIDELIDALLEMSRAELDQLHGLTWGGFRDLVREIGR